MIMTEPAASPVRPSSPRFLDWESDANSISHATIDPVRSFLTYWPALAAFSNGSRKWDLTLSL
jgi:hypothetical protein